jgi:hypothetical protein
MTDIESRVKAIEDRNRKVEQDKAWETSWVRRLSISALTYCVVFAYLNIINNDRPWINAIVPAVGYLLSTLVLKSIRQIWQK